MKLASLFRDGAVLQREKPIVVWGWCTPRVLVQATLGESVAMSGSAWDGRFELRLPPQSAGGPYELTVSEVESGEKCVVKDVLIGEVWLASGQSNMEFPLDTFVAGDKRAQTAEYLAEGGDDPFIRMATIPRNSMGAVEHTTETSWQASGPATAGKFTAVGAWYALRLRQKLGVPVGIIHCSWGGTPIQTWISRQSLSQNPNDAAIEDVNAVRSCAPKYWEQYQGKLGQECTNSLLSISYMLHSQQDRGNSGVTMGWAAEDFDDSKWQKMKVPGSWIAQGVNDNGATWARCTVDIPDSWAGKELKLNLGPIDKHDVSYFNGVEVGATGKGWETGAYEIHRCYTVPGQVVHAGRNTIAVRGFSFWFDGAFVGNSKEYFLEGPDGERLALPEFWQAKAEYAIEFSEEAQALRKRTSIELMLGSPFNCYGIHQLFDGMVRPLIPYTIRGVIWYQGCTDTTTPAWTNAYEQHMETLIRDWRFWWADRNMPFYYVQLANFCVPQSDRWAAVQEAQRRTARNVPGCGVITASDIGEPADIHPHDKRSCGDRLSRLALHYTYNMQDIVPEGPNYLRCSRCGDELQLEFQWADGLTTSDGEALRGFEVCDHNGVFFPATARIENNRVYVSAAKVPGAVAARYNWTSLPEGNLVNGACLPAPTFTTQTEYRC